jgi:phosphotransferase system enzyme I (PtsI)
MAAANAARFAADAGRAKPARTASGRRIAVHLNIAAPQDLAGLDPAICDGIGLVRTEFLFEASGGLPDEDTQYAAYRRILAWAEGRPVTIRTLDAGGDKPIAGLTIAGESNPFLGLRGIRLSLSRPDVFRPQLRALARAAVHGTLKVMLPMVAVPSELGQAGALLDAEITALRAEGVACVRPPLGIMVEVPAAALRAEDFDAAFYSIGSNDLTQYTMAAARDIGAVADLNDTGNPAVIALIARTVEAGRARSVEVSLCGDAAADTHLTRALLATGLTVLSVPPVAVARLKAAIATVSP